MINLQNGRQQILYLLEIAEVSYKIEIIFKAVIGQYNIESAFLHSHWRKHYTDIQRERKRVDFRLKLKVSTMDIWIQHAVGIKGYHMSPALACSDPVAVFPRTSPSSVPSIWSTQGDLCNKIMGINS